MRGDAHAVVGEGIAANVVHGEEHLHALGLGFLHELLGQINALLVQQGTADLAAHGDAEGVAHAAADEQHVNLVQQRLDDADLVLDLGAAQNGQEGAHRVFNGVAQEFQLLADQEAGHGGQIRGYTGGRGVRAMHGAKGVGNVDFSHGGQLLGERGVVLFLFRMEAHVLQQNGLAGLDLCGQLLGVGADNVLGELDFEAELLAQALGDRREGILHIEFSLGTAQMRAEDHGGLVVEQILDGGQRGVDARFIGNIQICIQRDVKVAADEHFFVCNLDIFNGHFVQIHFFLHSYLTSLYPYFTTHPEEIKVSFLQ